MRTSLLSLTAAITLVLASTSAAAFSAYRARVPNGNTASCGTCHVNAAIGGEGWNAFGKDVLRQDPEVTEEDLESTNQNVHYEAPTVPTWDANLCGADSDGDGQSNGEELGDPACSWVFGETPAFPRTTDISNPGDPASTSANPTGTDGGEGEGEGEGEGDPPPGCSSTGASATGAMVALLAMLGVRRRRA